MELARLVAAELAARPDWIDVARENLRRWRSSNAGSASLVRCYDEWLALLERPVEQVCAAMLASSDDGQRLRQNSPFAGVLPPSVVWAVKKRVRDGQAAA